MTLDEESAYDLLIVGGGVVGLSILRAATLAGWKCVLVEAEPDLLTWASGSNSGIVCTGVDASPGTLERALIRDSISRIRLFCKDYNIPTNPCGSIVCQWPWDGDENVEEKLKMVLEESHDAGDSHATRLTADQVRAAEPNLSPTCRGAVHIPGEVVLDPWLYSISLALHAKENGARIITDWRFDADASSFDGELWTAVRENSSLSENVASSPSSLKARVVVNAGGLWSDLLQTKTHSSCRWTAKPRRGQYRIFSASDKTSINHPIQPIPTQRTKGIFVFQTLYNQIVVGPTALDQESRTDRRVDSDVSGELASFVQTIVPRLNLDEDYIGDYVGIRPGTDLRDYQIHLFSRTNFVSAAGIRSTGLTASLGIGRHVVHLIASLLPEPILPEVISCTPLPPLAQLVHDYVERGDGYVLLQGEPYKVTHPLTKYGWESKTFQANR